MKLSDKQLTTGLAFSENARLMIDIKNIYKSGFNFYVINGGWSGSFNTLKNQLTVILYRDEKEVHDSVNDFKNVLKLTLEEKRQWYVTSFYDIDKIKKHEKESDIPF